jgi:hypothetical protein
MISPLGLNWKMKATGQKSLWELESHKKRPIALLDLLQGGLVFWQKFAGSHWVQASSILNVECFPPLNYRPSACS